MFTDPSLVVQSAISSFNNAAIMAPTFLWSFLLMLPLFALVYFYGNDFINSISWLDFKTPKSKITVLTFFAELAIFVWLILMPGNYAVLREPTSVLPFIISGVLFLVTASMIQKLKEINPPMPAVFQNIKRKRLFIWGLLLLIVAIAGFTGQSTVWGGLMQAAAVLSGMLVGRAWKCGTRPIFFTTFIIFVMTTTVLMQPEFFRFGQLGNLTIIHKLFLLLISSLTVAILAIRNVNPKNKISHGAFVKLKWILRILSGLCFILFILTESVPVFMGLTGILFVMFAVSVRHEESVSERLSQKMWALLLCSFGIIINIPLITAVGILYWISLPKLSLIKQSKFLL